jgi:hypothetical protein
MSPAVRLWPGVPSPRADSETRSIRQARAHERADRDVMGPSHPSEDQHIRARAQMPVPLRLPPHRLCLPDPLCLQPEHWALPSQAPGVSFRGLFSSGPPAAAVREAIKKEATATTLTRACARCGVSRCVVRSLEVRCLMFADTCCSRTAQREQVLQVRSHRCRKIRAEVQDALSSFSEKCQAGHWRQHKTFCKPPKTVHYVGSWS